MSERQKRVVYGSCLMFLNRLGVPVTPTAIQELVQQKADNPKDVSVEMALKLWRTNTQGKQDNRISQILGIYRRNMARLWMTIHCSHGDKTTIPIKETVLLAIFNDLDELAKDTILLQCYGAERYSALNLLPLENVYLVEDSETAILEIPAFLAKTGHKHPSIIPRDLAERMLERATSNGWPVLNPRYHTIWRGISSLSRSAFKVSLTSHYFRKRFESICETIPANLVNPNHWLILMGSHPTFGHMPDIYSLMSNHEIVSEYETHLMPRLALTGEPFKTQPNQLELVRRENAELRKQLLKLTELLTENLTR